MFAFVCALSSLALPSGALAATPNAGTGGVTSTGATSATVNGGVNPNGEVTQYHANYDVASSTWCISNGASGTPANSTSPQTLGYSDSTFHPVSVNLTGLTAGMSYCIAIVASNGSGSSPSNQVIFSAGAPGVNTFGASSTGASTATVNGGVNPFGLATSYRANYDTASSTWCSTGGNSGTPAHTTGSQALGFTDSSFHPVLVDLSGLTAGSKYCVQIVATNSNGTANGNTNQFTAGAPSANTWGAMLTGATTATLNGQVNPSGQTTTYKASYDVAGSEWCSTGGNSGTPAHSTTPQTLGFADSNFHPVSIDLTGLTAGTSYCAAITATNVYATSPSFPVSFTAGAPVANTNYPTSTSATAATIEGQVNPSGQATTYKASYDLAGSEWCSTGGNSGTPAHSTAPQTLPDTDSSFHDVSVNISGLTGGQAYCAAIVATNSNGTSSAFPTSFTAGVNPAGTGGVSSTGAGTATVGGQVNPAGQSTKYKASYDLANSTWCTSGGFEGSPANSTTPQTLGYTDATYHQVSVDLTGLTPGTEYCVEIVATNGSGSSPGNPVTFTAGVPAANTFNGRSTGATTVTVEGQVNPVGQATTYKASYDVAGSEWCQSGGGSGTPASSTTPQALGRTDSTYHQVSVDLTGLTPGAEYCVEIVATNGSGQSMGWPVSFIAATPAANTFNGRSTSATTVTVEGQVNPVGQVTTYKASYDVAGSEWCQSNGNNGTPTYSTAPQTIPFTDSSFHDVTVDLSGLTKGTSYCVAIVATNAYGDSPAFPMSFTAGHPAANTFGAVSTGTTTATVNGEVNPAGQSTEYKASYDVAGSEWCQSNGNSGAPAHSTSLQTLSFTDSSFHQVSVDLSGLTKGTSYCVAIIATNGSGASPAFSVSFTVGAPAVDTFNAFSTGATTAIVNGDVNPISQATTYKVSYDVAESEWCMSGGNRGTPAHSTTPQTLGYTDAGYHPVSVDLSGLITGTGYCAEIVATNGSGASTGFPTFFTAGAPSANTYFIESTGATTATLHGDVNPSGQATQYEASYDLASSTWCMSGGFNGSPAHSTSPRSLGYTDSTSHEASVDVTGLVPGTQYCMAITAGNSSGNSSPNPVQFTAGTPAITMHDMVSKSATETTVLGAIDPVGSTTHYKASYDLAGSEWCNSGGFNGTPTYSTASVPLDFKDSNYHEVSIDLTGLTAGAEYCVKMIASNTNGDSSGYAVGFIAGVPTAHTTEVTSPTATTATVTGEVNPAGQSTQYWAGYAPADSDWCREGAGGEPPNVTGNQSLSFTDENFHKVSFDVTGLTPGAKYCVAIIAGNANGRSSSFQRQVFFTFAPPPAPPAPPSPVSPVVPAETTRPPSPPVASVPGKVGTLGAKLKLTFACQGSAGQTCQGQAKATAIEKLSADGKTVTGVLSAKPKTGRYRLVTIAQGNLSAIASASRGFSIGLNSTGQALRKKFKNVPADVTITATAAGKTTTIKTAKVTFGPDPSKVGIVGAPATKALTITFKLRCTGLSNQVCKGTAKITTYEKLAADGNTVTGLASSTSGPGRLVTLASFNYSLRSGSTVKMSVTLNSTGKALLVKFGRIPATLQLTPTFNGYALTPVTEKVSFKR